MSGHGERFYTPVMPVAVFWRMIASSTGHTLLRPGSTRPGDEVGSARCGEECGEEHDVVWPYVKQRLEQASMQPIPKMQEVGGVRGALLTSGIGSSARARNRSHHWAHFIWGTVNAIPQRSLEGLMAQLSLTSAQLGEKYHGAWFASIFLGLGHGSSHV